MELDERERIIGEAVDRARTSGCTRIVLDFRNAHTKAVDAQTYERVAAYWAPRLMGTRLACLVTHDHQVSDGVEKRIRERGVAIERFHDLEAAIAWLAAPAGEGAAGDPARPDSAATAPAAQAEPGRPAPPRTDPRRVQRLLREVLDPGLRVPDGVARAVEQLLRELLEAGVQEGEALAIARRMSLAILRAASAR